MKKCPYCAEEIQRDAIKCKHCGEFLHKQRRVKWFFKPFGIVMAFLCFGPFALPIIWLHPELSRAKKIVITVVVFIATYFIVAYLANSVKVIIGHYQQLFEVM